MAKRLQKLISPAETRGNQAISKVNFPCRVRFSLYSAGEINFCDRLAIVRFGGWWFPSPSLPSKCPSTRTPSVSHARAPHRSGLVDVRLPGKGNSNSRCARPVHLIITMSKWFRTSSSSTKKSLCLINMLERLQVESGPLRAVHLSRHKWPGEQVSKPQTPNP
jgi:hypothetical protein